MLPCAFVWVSGSFSKVKKPTSLIVSAAPQSFLAALVRRAACIAIVGFGLIGSVLYIGAFGVGLWRRWLVVGVIGVALAGAVALGISVCTVRHIGKF